MADLTIPVIGAGAVALLLLSKKDEGAPSPQMTEEQEREQNAGYTLAEIEEMKAEGCWFETHSQTWT